MSSLLADSELEPHQRLYIKNIQACSKTLLDLINDVLLISRIVANKAINLEINPFKVPDIVYNINTMLGKSGSILPFLEGH